jgi:hypothetical protein
MPPGKPDEFTIMGERRTVPDNAVKGQRMENIWTVREIIILGMRSLLKPSHAGLPPLRQTAKTPALWLPIPHGLDGIVHVLCSIVVGVECYSRTAVIFILTALTAIPSKPSPSLS